MLSISVGYRNPFPPMLATESGFEPLARGLALGPSILDRFTCFSTDPIRPIVWNSRLEMTSILYEVYNTNLIAFSRNGVLVCPAATRDRMMTLARLRTLGENTAAVAIKEAARCSEAMCCPVFARRQSSNQYFE